jgi:LysM repeat protein
MRQRLLILGIVLLLSFAQVGLPTYAYQSTNLLQNPGFEGTFVTINGDATLQVASGWQPWSLPQTSSSVNVRPEYRSAPANRIHSGGSAQEYNTFYATHTGGLYQRVAVSPNTQLRFSVFVYVWSSATFSNQDVSEDPNDVLVRVGIDPMGGTDGTSSNIVWSSDAEYYDQYRELSITATSRSTAVTVFVRSAPQGNVGATNIYVDDAALYNLGAGPVPTTTTPAPTTPAPATSTPDPFEPTQEGTQSPTPTLRFSLTPRPSSTPTLPDGFNSSVTHVVRSGDTVSGLARQYGSTVNAIARANGLSNAGLIYVGQTLVIPVSGSNQPPTFTPASNQPTPIVSTPVPGGGVTTYQVKSGDTLSAIAARYNTTINTLAQLNNIVNPNLIYPGQVLSVPSGVVTPAATPTPVVNQPTPVPSTPGQPIRHTVQMGENLFRISLRYNVAMDVIARANNIWNYNLVFAGQVLIIPQ